MSNKNKFLGEQSIGSRENFFGEVWRSWCRLCAKADAHSINIMSVPYNSMDEKSFSCNINMACAIGKFFQVQMNEDDKLPQVICPECYTRIKNLNQFSDRVNKTQQMYDELLKCTNKEKEDLNGLLLKYGIFKDESEIPQYGKELPVEEIFVSDLLLTGNSGKNIKTEKVSIEHQTLPFIPTTDQKSQYLDPIGDESVRIGNKSIPSSEDEDNSSSDFSFVGLHSKESSSFECPTNSYIGSKRAANTTEDISQENYYLCSICAQSFQRRSNYYTHMKKKHEVFICSHCPNSFKSEFDLQGHMKEHQKLYSCKHCDKKFERKGAMSRHIKKEHKNECPYVCDACGEAIGSKKQLKQHMLTHDDYTPYGCKECGKGFKEKYRLKRHLEIHGDKLICTECGKQLSCRATFNSHMLVHSDKMPHKCDYCGRRFKRAKTLKYHLIAHTGLRPYSCDFCGKTFSTGSSCRFHKKTMHPTELAKLEASGAIAYTKNLPNLNVLKAV